MKNILLGILVFIACIPLFILLSFVAFAGYTAFVWVPLVLDLYVGLNFWVGLIIGTFITLATTILVSKLPD